MSIVNIKNEWDPLEEIIVGSALGAQIPRLDKGLKLIQGDSKIGAAGPFPKRIIEETEEDLEKLCQTLKQLDIRVRRPKILNTDKVFASPYWESDGMYHYCPRDILLTIDDMIIETPMSLRSRQYEVNAYKDFLIECLQSGSKWISAPKPELLDHTYNNESAEENILSEHEPIFDAANVLRAGNDIIYLVSSTGNKLGARWLQSILGSQYKVHLCENMYKYTHIDTTITLLREGLVLINPERVTCDNLPDFFKDWEVIEAPEMEDLRYTDVAYGSVWIGMNFIMVNPNLAIVCKHQKKLIKILEEHSIDVIPLELRHARTLGGGFHCVTLDVRRSRQKM